jgi:nicotinamidase-related amidase
MGTGVDGNTPGKPAGELEALKSRLADVLSQIEDLKSRLPPPVKIVEASLIPAKTALIIVDMQNDFCKVGGKLGPTEKTGEEAITAVALKIKALKDRGKPKGMKVVYTQDYHYPDDPEFKIWRPHCLVEKEKEVDKPTWGQMEISELVPEPDDKVIRKGGKTVSYDCFYATYKPNEMEETLEELNVDTCIVTGAVSNICVYCTVVGCAQRGYKTIVPVDGIVSLSSWRFTPAWSLFQWSTLYKVAITETGKIKFE